jgi:hypothetical protein
MPNYAPEIRGAVAPSMRGGGQEVDSAMANAKLRELGTQRLNGGGFQPVQAKGL